MVLHAHEACDAVVRVSYVVDKSLRFQLRDTGTFVDIAVSKSRRKIRPERSLQHDWS